MTDRPLDISTGRPADKRDHEYNAEIANEHGDKWKDRAGEVIQRRVLHDGFTFDGKVWMRGQVIAATVGGDAWILSLDSEGQSFLDLTIEEQLARWKRRMLAPVDEVGSSDDSIGDPYSDDKPHRPTPLPKPDPTVAALKALWAEEDRLAAEPYRTESRHAQ